MHCYCDKWVIPGISFKKILDIEKFVLKSNCYLCMPI